jgi:hypothetical protein
VRVSISKVRNNPNNPRIIKDDKFKKLVKSIQEFPEMLEKRPLICESSGDGSYVVLGGNMRLRACQQAGLKEIPIELADDWDIEQKRQFVIKDNIGYGEWDYSALAADYEMDELTDWGLDIPMGGHSINDMDENDIDLSEEFDPIGEATGLSRIVIIFDSESDAVDFHKENLSKYIYKKRSGGGAGSILQITLSTNYGK